MADADTTHAEAAAYAEAILTSRRIKYRIYSDHTEDGKCQACGLKGAHAHGASTTRDGRVRQTPTVLCTAKWKRLITNRQP